MIVLVLGLVLFLAPHLARSLAPDLRTKTIARIGEGGWKGAYSVVSIVGLGAIVWGFGLARVDPVVLFTPPLWLRHMNALFTLIAFVLFTAAYVPKNHLKHALGHPMYAGIKTWAFGHMLATGMLHDAILFVPVFLWAIVGFAVSRRRDRREGVTYPAGTAAGTIATFVIGAALWAAFAFWGHARVIGLPAFV